MFNAHNSTSHGLRLYAHGTAQVSHWRVPGVLQYLAWCNLLVPALLILAARGGPPADPTTTTEAPPHLLGRARLWSQRLTRLLFPAAWWEPCAALLLPTLHLALAYLIRAPGCPRGYVGPGGAYVDGGRLANCTGGAHGYLDRLLFSSRHLLQDPPCRAVYGVPGPFDPESAVGSLNAAFLFYVGALAGRVLLAPAWRPRDPRRALSWLALAAPCVLLAAILGGSGAVPVNKSLWSLSFVLAAAAVALAALAACHLLCDAFQVWPSGPPCAAVGRNALLVYVGHELLQDYFPFSFKLPASLENTHGGALLEDTVGVLVWLGIGALLHWRRVYIKV